MPHISIVSPVYKAEKLVKKLVTEIIIEVSKITNDFEIILVEDCSPDNSWQEIERMCSLEQRVIGIKLSRNFGQQYAINAGLDQASGLYTVIMDCDLQDPPSEIVKLYRKALEGFDIVFASRQNRQDNFLKKFFSKKFNDTLGYLSNTEQDYTVANFVLIEKRVLKALNNTGDYYRYYPMLLQWIGFKSTKIEIRHAERIIGESSYSFKKRLKLAFNTIIAFSDKPLLLMVKLGIIICFLSGLGGGMQIISFVYGEIDVEGWTSLMFLICFFSGLIIITLGLLGVYIGKMFETVKNRPTYIIESILNRQNNFERKL